MTLFFDIEKLERESKGNDALFLAILEDYYNVKMHYKMQKLNYKSIAGISWLINPTPLFNKKVADLAYIVQYIKLAGRRNYMLYKLYNILTLDISFYPNLILDNIQHNPLLTIIGNNIHFKFEFLKTNKEILNGIEIW